MISFEIDTTNYKNAIREFAATVKKDSKEVLRDEMRLLVQRIIELTPPFTSRGNNKAGKDLGEQAVKRDIEKTFYTADKLVEYIRNDRLKLLAQRYVIEGNMDGLRKIFSIVSRFLKEIQIENNARPDYHQSVRNRRGRVPKGVTPIFVINARSVLKYIKDTQKHVGRAKAGWNPAAEMFKVTGVPSWVKRHTEKTGSAADQLDNPFVGYIEAVNNFKSINNLDNDKSIVAAAMATRERDIKTKIEAAMKYSADKFNR